MTSAATTPALNLREYAMAMAHYNRWMNGKLYAACAELSDEQRKADRGAFFKSLHGTLNHLVLVDQAWLQRLHGQAVTMSSPAQELHDDFNELRAARLALDDALQAWAESLASERETELFRFFSVAYQKEFALPLWGIVLQIFNHQTHHRAQAGTLLTQFGIDIGVTDVPLMPYWDDVNARPMPPG